MSVAGSLWIGKLVDKEYCEKLVEELSKRRELKNGKRMRKILNLIIEEVDGPPTYFDVGEISDKFGCLTPSPRKVVAKLHKERFFASLTHFKSTGIRTDAPSERVIEIIKELG